MKNPSPNTNIEEHYLRAGKGTQTACSCGKTFAFISDANQHIEWQLRTLALTNQREKDLVEEAMLKGRQKEFNTFWRRKKQGKLLSKDYFTRRRFWLEKRIKALSKESET